MHFSEPSSLRPSPVMTLRCPEHVPSPSRTRTLDFVVFCFNHLEHDLANLSLGVATGCCPFVLFVPPVAFSHDRHSTTALPFLVDGKAATTVSMPERASRAWSAAST